VDISKPLKVADFFGLIAGIDMYLEEQKRQAG